MDNHLDPSGLRERLGCRMQLVLTAPSIEQKELAAVDIIMRRREVLGSAGFARRDRRDRRGAEDRLDRDCGWDGLTGHRWKLFDAGIDWLTDRWPPHRMSVA